MTIVEPRLTYILKKFAVLLCAIFISIPALALADNKHPYELGIFPHLSKSHLQRTYDAIGKNLSKNVDRNIHFDVNESITNFYRHLRNEYYDIILVQPFEYIVLAEKYGYTPLASLKAPLKALIVTKKGGAIQNIQNLLGRKLVLPPDSTAISYLTKKLLHDFGFNLDKDILISHEKTHIACLQKLLLGFTDACATFPAALNFFERKMEVKFQVISQTLEIPHTLFAIHPRVNSNHKKVFSESLVNWSNTPEGKAMLTSDWLMPLRHITNKEYDIVRKIKKEVDAY